jgi:hypothetical protein
MNNNPTKAQRERWGRIAALGCIICGRPADIHHCLITAGCRKNHDLVIPLCPEHHRHGQYGVSIHAGKTEFEARFGTETFLLENVSKLVDL